MKKTIKSLAGLAVTAFVLGVFGGLGWMVASLLGALAQMGFMYLYFTF